MYGFCYSLLSAVRQGVDFIQPYSVPLWSNDKSRAAPSSYGVVCNVAQCGLVRSHRTSGIKNHASCNIDKNRPLAFTCIGNQGMDSGSCCELMESGMGGRIEPRINNIRQTEY